MQANFGKNGDFGQTLEAIDSLLEMDAKKLKENQEKKEGDGPVHGIMKPVEKNNLLLYRLKVYEESKKW